MIPETELGDCEPEEEEERLWEPADRDAKFIVGSRTAVPQLTSMLKRAMLRLGEL